MASIYNKTSPYFLTPINGSYLDILTLREVISEPDDVRFEVTTQYEYRPDLLSYDLYKDVNLWWVFSVRNRDILKDPIYDLYAGQIILLPKFSTLKRTLNI